jgi:hypothetical protein
MRAKTNTASKCWRTILAGAVRPQSFGIHWKIHCNLTDGIPACASRLRGRGTREEIRKKPLRLGETFRPSQVVFLGPDDPDTLIIDSF